ncbi:MAG TPA: vWA domain-containing protein [Thermomicrobiaceae bacterium]|nr:vWA domain-containing protein [Thermomicrobiaceae bacterium]
MRSTAARGLRLVMLIIFVLSLAPLVAFAQGVDPSSVSQNLDPGATFTLTKTVHTPAIPPNPDIVFLSDTTGSMGSAIANVQANIGSIASTVLTAQPTAQFAVAEYKDGDPNTCPSDPFAFKLDQALMPGTADVSAWSASGGCDTPESQLYALDQLATGAVTFRPNSTRIIVWFGDASGHDPALGVTLSGAISALQAANIAVIAIPVNSGAGDGLDATGQATAITTATGGELMPAATPDQVSGAILSGLGNLPVTVTPQLASADTGLSVGWDAPSKTVTSGTDATFTETISVAADAPQGTTLHATVDFLLNGQHQDGFTETIAITVNDITPPVPACEPSTNPAGKNVPGANANPKAGQNPDGFYLLTATDNVDAASALKLYVADSAGSFVAGPYASGTTVKITQAPGATPGATPMAGAVSAHITLNGDALVYAVDTAGNQSARVACLVPPPPK